MRKNQIGFSGVLVILIVATTAAVVGYILYTSSTSTQSNQSTSLQEVNYIKKQILVVFKPGTSSAEALAMLNKHNLSPTNPDTFFKYQTAVFVSTEDNVDEISNKVESLSFVDSTFPANKSDGIAKQSFIDVNFKSAATLNEIQEILALSNTLSFNDSAEKELGRLELIKVPEGQEEKWAEKLRSENIIKSSSLNHTLTIN